MRSGSRLLPGKDSEAGNGLELNWEDLWDLGLEPYWPGAPASLCHRATLKGLGGGAQGRDGAEGQGLCELIGCADGEQEKCKA